ncbi:hypothetical protein [Anaerosalibacter massiliensis]|uniref:DUF2007 domain-containing protein n=1 Tax=Anaerosalibacter massiliensis TaxID=1347392 RepID=A0A9X2MHV6_9FIRM|nr:hypothetical protein [Anaerosalibacter massiliensis]MCR2043974.1 hypothetical protein [Anaerosalibacter massiliensis]
MWTAIHVVDDYSRAKEIENILVEEGFLVKIRIFDKDGDSSLYKILAPELEAEDIQLALMDLGII